MTRRDGVTGDDAVEHEDHDGSADDAAWADLIDPDRRDFIDAVPDRKGSAFDGTWDDEDGGSSDDLLEELLHDPRSAEPASEAGVVHDDALGLNEPTGNHQSVSAVGEPDHVGEAVQTTQPKPGLRGRRKARAVRQAAQNEARWAANRYSVPYRTGGPIITLAVLWFLAVVGGLVAFRPLAAFVLATVAAVAALQTGFAWAHVTPADRRVSAGLAFVVALAGVFGAFPLGLATVIASLGALLYAAVGVKHSAGDVEDGSPVVRFAEVTIRAAVPVGVAAGSVLALGRSELVAVVALLVLVSAYDAGDFLVGTGSANAFEGPVAGLVTMAFFGYGFQLLQPEPFDGTSALLFWLMTAVACPLGQILGSAILPRGDAWAPALRRLDTLLVAAPLWLLLVP